MNHSQWLALLCVLALALVLSARPLILHLADYLRWRRHERAARGHRGDGGSAG
jgi:hypothetical protein